MRNDVATLLPVLQQAASQYSLAVTVDGRILLTPEAPRRIAQPLRLQQLSPSSFSSSVPSTLITSQAHYAVPHTRSTPVQCYQDRLVVSAGSCTPTPTVPFPKENDESSSSVTVASSTPVQYYEEQNRLPLHSVSCTPSPSTSFPEHNVDNSSSVVRHFAPCDLLPIPKVPHIGPRMLKSNKRLGSARNLTSDQELQKSKEAYEEKLRKETKKQETALKKANNQGKNKGPIVRVCL